MLYLKLSAVPYLVVKAEEDYIFLAPYSPSASLYTPLALLDMSLVTVTQ